MLAAKFRFSTVLIVASLSLGISGVTNAESWFDTYIKQINGMTVSNLAPKNVTHAAYVPYTPDYGGASYLQIYNGGVPNFHSGALYTFSNGATTVIPYKDHSGCANQGGDPIIFNTGSKVETYTDFQMPGEMGLKYVRYYNTGGYPRWSNSFSYSLDPTCQGNTPCHKVTVYRPDGSTVVFPGAFSGKTITINAAALTYNVDGTYTLQDEDTLVETYSAAGQIQSLKDVSGVGWTFSYPSGSTTVVTHTNGQFITLSETGTAVQGPNGFVFSDITTVTDPAGNVYTYDSGNGYTPNSVAGDIASATFPGSPATVVSYKYSDINATADDMLSEVDYNGVPYSYTSYNATTGWATSTYFADNTELTSASYGSTSGGNLQTTITNPLGHVTTNVYAGINGQLSSVSDNAVSDCGSTVNARVYDANGSLQQATDNNGNIHTYTYAANGQLQTETEAYGTPQARTTNYVWDPNVQLNRLTSATIVGWSQTSYTYNAQNRLASVTVTNLSGNGAAGQALTTLYNYTLYANGMIQTMSVTHPSPNNIDTDVTTYDALGNVTSVANGLGQTTTYSNYTGLGEPQRVVGPNGNTTNYIYDARGRVVTKTTHPNGMAATWSYTYDGFGLLYTETTPDNEVTTWTRDAEMRVRTITHNDKDGTSTETFGYDPMSDVTSHVVTRGGVTALSETATYDALGRLYQKQGAHGQTLTYGYDGNGNVLSVTNAAGHLITYQYDALNRVTATAESGGASPPMTILGTPTPSAPSSVTAPSTYTVSWNSVPGGVSYVLERQVDGGDWNTIQNSAALTRLEFPLPGMYGYRVAASNDDALNGPWSSVITVAVVPFGPYPVVPVGVNSSGSYSVSWSSSVGDTSFVLQEQVNGGSWATVQSSAATSWSIIGRSNGSYAYRVQACGTAGCGPWSSPTYPFSVALLPTSAPTLSVPSSSYTGSYTVSWTSVSNATSYSLQEQVNGGSWTSVQSNSATSWSTSGRGSGAYGYQVQACSAGGCGPWSGVSSTTVTLPPAVPTGLTLSSNEPTQQAQVMVTASWNASPGATTYSVQYSDNSGPWINYYSGPMTNQGTSLPNSTTASFEVQACNVAGCSSWTQGHINLYPTF